MSDLTIGAPRVLVIFPGALGDLMLAMPAIASIAQRNRGASIELMARNELARLAVGRSVVTRAHSIDRREVTALFAKSDLEESRAREFFDQLDRIYSFFAFDDARFRAALTASTRGIVSFHRFRPDGEGHICAAYLREIGESQELKQPTSLLVPTQEDIAEANKILQSARIAASRLVAIFPGSGDPKKNWPAKNFVELAKRLSAESDATPIIILGPAEEYLRALFRDASLPVIENLELSTVAALAQMSACFVGNDSGVSHLAATVGARGVVLFGPTDPARWRPLGRIEILHRDPLESLEVAEVAAAVAAMMTRPLAHA